MQYQCEVVKYEEDAAKLLIQSTQKSDCELPVRVTLYQGLPKGDKMEWIIQKAVELGVSEIVPVAMKRSVVKLDEKKATKKCERWNAVALSAAKQSGRGIIPHVAMVQGVSQMLQESKALDVLLLPYEKAQGMQQTREVIGSIQPGQRVGIWIGPEGGFDEEEVEAALCSGAKVITLGKRILRTETAGLMVLSILNYHLEE
jgi:16S rRNA (uracil1498-N3)-methyltransferase